MARVYCISIDEHKNSNKYFVSLFVVVADARQRRPINGVFNVHVHLIFTVATYVVQPNSFVYFLFFFSLVMHFTVEYLLIIRVCAHVVWLSLFVVVDVVVVAERAHSI